MLHRLAARRRLGRQTGTAAPPSTSGASRGSAAARRHARATPSGARHRCARSGRTRARRCRAASGSRRARPRAARRPASGSARATPAAPAARGAASADTGGMSCRCGVIARIASAIWSSVASTSSRPACRECLPLDAAGDLIERLAEARGPVLLLDQARHQIGLVVRHVRVEHAARCIARISRLSTSIAAKCFSASSGADRHAARDREEQSGGLEIARASPAGSRDTPFGRSLSSARIEVARLRIVLLVLRARGGRSATARGRTRR